MPDLSAGWFHEASGIGSILTVVSGRDRMAGTGSELARSV